jgi:hypothetical protein
VRCFFFQCSILKELFNFKNLKYQEGRLATVDASLLCRYTTLYNNVFCCEALGLKNCHPPCPVGGTSNAKVMNKNSVVQCIS